MNDPDRLLSLRPSPAPLATLSDAEVVLLELVLRSGLKIHPHRRTDADQSVEAVTLDARLRVALKTALAHRGITSHTVAARVVERALDALEASDG